MRDYSRKRGVNLPNAESPPAGLDWLGPVPVACLGLVGLFALGRWPLWGDEMFTLWLSAMPRKEAVATVAGDIHPPLYFLSVRAVVAVLGTSDPVLRALTLAASLATVAIAGRIGTGVFPRKVRWTSALLLALWPYHVVYSVTARPYAVVATFGAIFLWASIQLATGSRPRIGAAVLAVAGALGIYVSYATAMPFAAAAVAVVAGAPARLRRRRLPLLAAACCGVALVFLPWLASVSLRQAARIGEALEVGGYGLRAPLVLLWPLGGQARASYISDCAWVLLVLQGVGLAMLSVRRHPLFRALAAWAGCAVGLPTVLQGVPGFHNTYPFIGFLPLAATLASIGVVRLLELVPTLSGRRALLPPGLVVAALHAPPLAQVARLRSAPFGAFEEGKGSYDVRLDIAVFDAVPVDVASIDFGGALFVDRAFRHYTANTGTTATPAAPDWSLSPRPQTDVEPMWSEKSACTFSQAFVSVASVQKKDDCARLAGVLEERARASDYAPLLLEMADRAFAAGDYVVAEDWALRAVEAEPYGCAAALWLGQMYHWQKRPADALLAVEAGRANLATWRADRCAFHLAPLGAWALTELDRSEEVEDALAEIDCLASARPRLLCHLLRRL